MTQSSPPSLTELLSPAFLEPGARVADIGCFGWRLAALCEAASLSLHGFDRGEPPGRPDSACFETMRGSRLDARSGRFQACVASHVIEHLEDPTELVREIARVLAPAGLAWIEAPSDMSAMRPASDDAFDNRFENFWDDPTHKRPHTPGSLHRLCLSAGLFPLSCARVDEGIPSARILARKPRGMPSRVESRYVSLKGCAPGALAAWRAVWPEFDPLA